MKQPLSPSRLRAARRGITLLEVLLAVMLMSLTVASVMGAISSIALMETNARHRLEAYEIANRIMLQYLDDEQGLPSKTLPITYGDHKFFWELDKTPARMVINRKQESGGANLQALDRFLLIDVTVYDSDSTGQYDIKAEPIAGLARVIDPAAPRNPDSIDTFGTNPDKIRGLINTIVGVGPSNTGTARRSGGQFK